MPAASTGSVLLARFWGRVRMSDGCWEWAGQRNRYGYGRITVQQIAKLTHRLSWELAHGPIPDGTRVLHRCDNPPCVRPDHLFLGSQADNIADMWKKGRARPGRLSAKQQAAIRHPRGDDHWMRKHPERITRGAAHGKSKLTDDDVREIRRLRAAGVTYRVISSQFGISDGTIGFIVNRTTWQHVKD